MSEAKQKCVNCGEDIFWLTEYDGSRWVHVHGALKCRIPAPVATPEPTQPAAQPPAATSAQRIRDDALEEAAIAADSFEVLHEEIQTNDDAKRNAIIREIVAAIRSKKSATRSPVSDEAEEMPETQEAEATG